MWIQNFFCLIVHYYQGLLRQVTTSLLEKWGKGIFTFNLPMSKLFDLEICNEIRESKISNMFYIKDVFKTCIGKVICMEGQKLAFFVHCFGSECLANQPTTVLELGLSVALFELNLLKFYCIFVIFFTRGNFFGNLLHPFELK